VLGHTSANNYNVGLSITQALFPFTSQSASVDKAEAAMVTAQATLDDARVTARARLARAAAEFAREQNAVAVAEAGAKAAAQNLQLAQALQARGRLGQDGVTQARADWVQADALSAATQRQLAGARWVLAALQQPSDLLARLRLTPPPVPESGGDAFP
jgi:outer membrane protein TolC